MRRLLAVRLDSDGDVLLSGPAIRALAHAADAVDLLVSSQGRQAAGLLPGVRDVLVADVPWSGYRPPPADPAVLAGLVGELRARAYDGVVVFTSFHQSPLPMALLARMAGIGFVAGTSEDYPGSLLDVRHRRAEGWHEVEAALDLAIVAGGSLPPGDRGTLAVRSPLPPRPPVLAGRDYVVLHPGASVPSRAPDPGHARRIAAALVEAGRTVVVTGGPGERELVAAVCDGLIPAAGPGEGRPGGRGEVLDLAGRTDLGGLAAVLAGASCTVVGNTGPAHLAAAVGCPVVSLFSPVVPADRWAPYGVPTVLLGDQDAPCRDSRARECPVDGHPCLGGVPPHEVVAAVDRLSARRAAWPSGRLEGAAS